jgi:TonB family protein
MFSAAGIESRIFGPKKKRGAPDGRFLRRKFMSDLISKNPRMVSPSSRCSAIDAPHGAEVYNRSSLALDMQGTASLAWVPVTPLSPRSLSAGGAQSDALVWKGANPFEFKRDPTSSAVSFVVHVVVIALILWLAAFSHQAVVHVDDTTVTPVHFTLYDPPPPVMPTAKVMGGGGGGGAHQLAEPVKGHLPKVAKVETLPPQIARIERPKLAVEPTLQVKIPDNSNMPNFGVAQSPQIMLASQGSGSGSGFGHGTGGGIGMGHGIGSGPGSGGGYGGGLMSVGGGVSAPQVIHSVDPEFTESARSANYQGTVSIQLIVDSQGNPQNVQVVRHLGMGLDEKAIQAVRQYRFRPAIYQGHPVAVQMVIDVDFHLH